MRLCGRIDPSRPAAERLLARSEGREVRDPRSVRPASCSGGAGRFELQVVAPRSHWPVERQAISSVFSISCAHPNDPMADLDESNSPTPSRATSPSPARRAFPYRALAKLVHLPTASMTAGGPTGGGPLGIRRPSFDASDLRAPGTNPRHLGPTRSGASRPRTRLAGWLPKRSRHRLLPRATAPAYRGRSRGPPTTIVSAPAGLAQPYPALSARGFAP